MEMLIGINVIGAARVGQIEDLTLQLRQSKMFLNMVIHDMRNPTVSIKLGLQASIAALRSIGVIFKDQLLFSDKIKLVDDELKSNESLQEENSRLIKDQG